MIEALMAYEMFHDSLEVGNIAYELYSNWGPINSVDKLKKKVVSSDKLARVAIVGLGGAGKTTLIQTMTGCDGADPKIATLGVCPIILGREEKSGLFSRTTRTSIVYCDTDGQKPNSFLKKMFEAKSGDILFRGCFDAIIFVVDVKSPGATPARDGDVVDLVEWTRLDEHVSEWSHYALNFLFLTMSEKLKLCAIFINKCNLVRDLNSSNKDRIRREVEDKITPFVQKLRDRTRGVAFDTIFGSALEARDVSNIRRLVDLKC